MRTGTNSARPAADGRAARSESAAKTWLGMGPTGPTCRREARKMAFLKKRWRRAARRAGKRELLSRR